MKHNYRYSDNENFGLYEVFRFIAKAGIILMAIVIVAIVILEVILKVMN